MQFKRAHRNFVLAPTASRNIHPGDFVKVEADRGEDLGVVLSRTPADQFEEVMPTAGYRGRGFSTGQGERKLILRLATPEERASVASKVHDEEVALQVSLELDLLSNVYLYLLLFICNYRQSVKRLQKEG